MFKRKLNWQVLLVYLIGNIVLAFGVCLNTKTFLGVSPVSSVVYNLSVITGYSFGVVNFFYLCFLIFLQFLLLRKDFQLLQLGQVFASFIGSFFLEIFDQILVVPESLIWRVLALFVGIITTGLGASLVVGMQLVPNPADALAATIGQVLKKNFGFGKNILDLCSISIALVLGLYFEGSLLGIGLGTVVAVFMTGRVIALCHPYTERIYKKMTASRI